ncbi:hypothetical protein BCR44DRAFT_1178007 [Catenaria anguillulae PL171]|uniref:Uncharacterized protein n=1 Tax=Catenaria anguillulae PL171 TaxID=765915 RepID=A0A1Y2HI19_9FUNG|nr:hypothetical protein BCR44DRAFT_1178007 [Catenaria anguillulae PL171]
MTVAAVPTRQNLHAAAQSIHDLSSRVSPPPNGKFSMSIATATPASSLDGGASSVETGAGVSASAPTGAEPGQAAASSAESHRTVAQRTLAQHLSHHGEASLDVALAEIHPGLVSQFAPAPSYRILAAFDDIATHVLLDSLFLGFRTRKMDLGVQSMRSSDAGRGSTASSAALRQHSRRAESTDGQQQQQQQQQQPQQEQQHPDTMPAVAAAAGPGGRTIALTLIITATKPNRNCNWIPLRPPNPCLSFPILLSGRQKTIPSTSMCSPMPFVDMSGTRLH